MKTGTLTKSQASVVWFAVERGTRMDNCSFEHFETVHKVITALKGIYSQEEKKPNQKDAGACPACRRVFEDWEFFYEDKTKFQIDMDGAEFKLAKDLVEKLDLNLFRISEDRRNLIIELFAALKGFTEKPAEVKPVKNGEAAIQAEA